MSQTIGAILTILGAIGIVYLFLRFGLRVAEFGWWGAITAVLIALGVFLLFTREESPAFAVPLIDNSVRDVDGALQESYTLERLVEAFGQQPEDWSLKPGSADSGLPASLRPESGPPAQEAEPQAQQQPAGGVQYTAPTFPVNVTLKPGSVIADMTNGTAVVYEGEITVCSWKADEPGTLVLCDGRIVGAHNVTDQSVLPPPQQSQQEAAQPQYDTTQTNAAKANCWTTWASVYLVGEVEPGQMALPTGTGPWQLRAKGDWNNNFRGKDNEVWFLSNALLGIVDFVVNGWVGRSFSNANDSGSVMVYGSNPNIWTECLALVNP